MWKVYAAVVLAWIILLPPLFTDGACTAEFDAETARLQADAGSLRTYDGSLKAFAARRQPVATMTRDQCRAAKPRNLASCPSGPLVIIHVPVKNPVCRIYRDDEIRTQLQYDEFGRLARMATDMDPYKSLPIPGTGITLHWAR